MSYKDLFFDLDHTIWDFELNSKETLWDLHQKYALEAKGIIDFDTYYNQYSVHNHRLWDRYTKGFIMFYLKVYSETIDNMKKDLNIMENDGYRGLHITIANGKHGNVYPWWPKMITIK